MLNSIKKFNQSFLLNFKKLNFTKEMIAKPNQNDFYAQL